MGVSRPMNQTFDGVLLSHTSVEMHGEAFRYTLKQLPDSHVIISYAKGAPEE